MNMWKMSNMASLFRLITFPYAMSKTLRLIACYRNSFILYFYFFFGFTVFLRLVKPNTRHLTPKSFLPRKIAKMSKKVKEKMIKNRLVIRVRSHFINYQI